MLAAIARAVPSQPPPGSAGAISWRRETAVSRTRRRRTSRSRRRRRASARPPRRAAATARARVGRRRVGTDAVEDETIGLTFRFGDVAVTRCPDARRARGARPACGRSGRIGRFGRDARHVAGGARWPGETTVPAGGAAAGHAGGDRARRPGGGGVARVPPPAGADPARPTRAGCWRWRAASPGSRPSARPMPPTTRPPRLQPLAELVRTSAGAEFVVFTDAAGVRYSHPDPEKIGAGSRPTPASPSPAPSSSAPRPGTLGVSLRAKVPVRDDDGEIVGQVSVGILESELSADLADVLPRLVAWLTGAAFVGVLGAVGGDQAGAPAHPRSRAGGDRRAAAGTGRDAARHPRGRRGRRRPRPARAGQRRGGPAARASTTTRPGASRRRCSTPTTCCRSCGRGRRLRPGGAGRGAGARRQQHRRARRRPRRRPAAGPARPHRAVRGAAGPRRPAHHHRRPARPGPRVLQPPARPVRPDRAGPSEEAVGFIERVGGGSGAVAGRIGPRRSRTRCSPPLVLAKTAIAPRAGADPAARPGLRRSPTGVGDDVVTIVANLVDNAVDASRPGGTVDLFVRHRRRR